jgi:phospholipid transport system substrate-binding protein
LAAVFAVNVVEFANRKSRKNMKILNKLLFAIVVLSTFGFSNYVSAQEAPDALVKRISQEVLEIARTDKEVQKGNPKRMLGVVEAQIAPYIDFQRMTALAAGPHWRDSSAEQQKQLTNEFRALLVYTYSSAMSQIKGQRLEFKPMRADAQDTAVEVRSTVIQPHGEPIELTYRLQKQPSGWKIYDVNIMGVWLIEAYKGTFTSEINKAGINGLIATLAEKNKRLAANAAKSSNLS